MKDEDSTVSPDMHLVFQMVQGVAQFIPVQNSGSCRLFS